MSNNCPWSTTEIKIAPSCVITDSSEGKALAKNKKEPTGRKNIDLKMKLTIVSTSLDYSESAVNMADILTKTVSLPILSHHK